MDIGHDFGLLFGRELSGYLSEGTLNLLDGLFAGFHYSFIINPLQRYKKPM